MEQGVASRLPNARELDAVIRAAALPENTKGDENSILHWYRAILLHAKHVPFNT